MSERTVFLHSEQGLAPGPDFTSTIQGIRERRPLKEGKDMFTTFGELAVAAYRDVPPEDIASVIIFNAEPPLTHEENQALMAGIMRNQEEAQKVEVIA